MTTVQIPPEGVAAEFDFEVPAPPGMGSISGVKLYFTFGLEHPDLGTFVPRLFLNGEQRDLSDSGTEPLSVTRIAQLLEAVDAPVQARVVVNSEGSLKPGNLVTVYAWGAQTESGEGALNPDTSGEPSTLTDIIEVGQAKVVSWQEWNRITGANQGEEQDPPGS